MSKKIAYITGGTKGIGRGVAEKMLEAGFNVAISGRTASTVEQIANELSSKYDSKVLPITSNVRKMSDEQAAVKLINETWGEIDVVIANAGVGHFASIHEMTEDQWHNTIDINLTGVFHTTKATLDSLTKTEGYLITIASLAGTNFFAKGAAYNASKFGLVGFSQAVMLDVRDQGVKVTTIMPGSVSTHFNGNEPSDSDAWKIQPEDIGQLVMDLIHMNPRTLPSKVEVRPTIPGGKK